MMQKYVIFSNRIFENFMFICTLKIIHQNLLQ